MFYPAATHRVYIHFTSLLAISRYNLNMIDEIAIVTQ